MPLSPSTKSKIAAATQRAYQNFLFSDEAINNARQILDTEADRMLSLLQGRIDAYYNSYSPILYQRTDNFRNNTLRKSPVTVLPDGSYSVSVYFDSEASTYDGLPDYVENNPPGFVPLLIDSGWTVDPVHTSMYGTPNKNEHFGHFAGFDIIDHAVNEYLMTKHEQVTIDVSWG